MLISMYGQDTCGPADALWELLGDLAEGEGNQGGEKKADI